MSRQEQVSTVRWVFAPDMDDGYPATGVPRIKQSADEWLMTGVAHHQNTVMVDVVRPASL
jgi:hypothetical protein